MNNTESSNPFTPSVNDWGPWLRLSLTPGLGPRAAKLLIDSLGSLDNIFDTPDPQVSLLLSHKQVQALKVMPIAFLATRHICIQAQPFPNALNCIFIFCSSFW